MMSKENFINVFKQVDDSYIPKEYEETVEFCYAKEFELNKYKSMKDFFIKENKPYCLSNVDIQTINELCTHQQDVEKEMINPFEPFYKLDDNVSKSLFHILVKTHRAIDYYEKYSENTRELKSKNTHGNISKKINDVIEYIYDTDEEAKLDEPKNNGSQAIQYLKYLVQSLDNNHYTLRQAFQDLLYELHNLLSNKDISKSKIITIVNSLIKHYFGKDIIFTVSTKVENFTTINYRYHSMVGIDLTHGKK